MEGERKAKEIAYKTSEVLKVLSGCFVPITWHKKYYKTREN